MQRKTSNEQQEPNVMAEKQRSVGELTNMFENKTQRSPSDNDRQPKNMEEKRKSVGELTNKFEKIFKEMSQTPPRLVKGTSWRSKEATQEVVSLACENTETRSKNILPSSTAKGTTELLYSTSESNCSQVKVVTASARDYELKSVDSLAGQNIETKPPLKKKPVIFSSAAQAAQLTKETIVHREACLTDDSLVSQKNVLPSSAAKVVQLTEDSIDHRYPFLESNCSRVKVETRSAKDRYELESAGQQYIETRSKNVTSLSAAQSAQLTEETIDHREGNILGHWSNVKAFPLCLPNNYEWLPDTGKCCKNQNMRSSLCIMKNTVQQLENIKGPVCVVSVAGKCSQGKSFLLSELCDQTGVFPLGHEMETETKGIWFWIASKKYKGSDGEFTLVLLDTEGIDVAVSEGMNEYHIFTLTVLLTSVLIYNFQGIPTKQSVEELKSIVKQAQRIQECSRSEGGDKEGIKGFPNLIWLLRDAAQRLPEDCVDVKDYFRQKIFEQQPSSELRLHPFSGFDAFKLPPPAFDNEVKRKPDETERQVNSSFWRGLDDFKALLEKNLAQHSVSGRKYNNGKDLLKMVEHYAKEVNKRSGVKSKLPNKPKWDVLRQKTERKEKLRLEQENCMLQEKIKRLEKTLDEERKRFREKLQTRMDKKALEEKNNDSEERIKELKETNKKLMASARNFARSTDKIEKDTRQKQTQRRKTTSCVITLSKNNDQSPKNNGVLLHVDF